MCEQIDSWNIFRSSQLGSNIQEVVETPECKVFRLDDESGEGTMTLYRVFDGVFLMYNDFHMDRLLPFIESILQGSERYGTYFLIDNGWLQW